MQERYNQAAGHRTMKNSFYIFIFITFSRQFPGQTKFVGTFLLNNGMDSVTLQIKKDGSFKTIETSMCHGDDILGSKGKWESKGDTLILITYSRSRSGQKTKNYEYKPTSCYLLRKDSLFRLDERKQLKHKFSYHKTK
jgi:hypothetical protein